MAIADSVHDGNAILMRDEWIAWMNTNDALEKIDNGSWDDERYQELHAAILLWGERLAALRMSQTQEIRNKALEEVTRRYATLVLS